MHIFLFGLGAALFGAAAGAWALGGLGALWAGAGLAVGIILAVAGLLGLRRADARLAEKLGASGGQTPLEAADALFQRVEKAEHDNAALRNDLKHTRDELLENHNRLDLMQSARRMADKNAQQRTAVLQRASDLCSRLSEDVRGLAGMVSDVEKGVQVQHDRLESTTTAMNSIVEAAQVSSNSSREVWDSARSSYDKASLSEQESREAQVAIEDVKSAMLSLREAMRYRGAQIAEPIKGLFLRSEVWERLEPPERMRTSCAPSRRPTPPGDSRELPPPWPTDCPSRGHCSTAYQ